MRGRGRNRSTTRRSGRTRRRSSGTVCRRSCRRSGPGDTQRDARPARARVKAPQTMVAGAEGRCAPGHPDLGTGAGNGDAAKPVPLPNVVAAAPPKVVRPFAAPPETRDAAGGGRALADAPRVAAADVKTAFTLAGRDARAGRARAFTPPPECPHATAGDAATSGGSAARRWWWSRMRCRFPTPGRDRSQDIRCAAGESRVGGSGSFAGGARSSERERRRKRARRRCRGASCRASFRRCRQRRRRSPPSLRRRRWERGPPPRLRWRLSG